MADSLSRDDLLTQQKKEKKELMAKTQKMKHSVPKGNKRKRKEITSKIAQMFADLDLKHEEQLREFEDKDSATKHSLAGEMPKEILPTLGTLNLDSESCKNQEQNSISEPNDLSSTSSQVENSTTNPSYAGGVRRKMLPVSRSHSSESGKDSEPNSPTDNPHDLPSTFSQDYLSIFTEGENSTTNPSWSGGARKKVVPISRARSPESGKNSEPNSPTDNAHDLPSTLSQANNSATNSSWEGGVRRKMFPISGACGTGSGNDLEHNSSTDDREDFLAAYYRDKNANSLYIRDTISRPRSPESGKHSEQNSPTQDYIPRTDEEFIDGIPREIFPILRAPSPDSGKDSMPSSPPGTRVDIPSPSSQDENSRAEIIQEPKKQPTMKEVFEDIFPEPYTETVKQLIASVSEKDTEQNASADNPDDLPSASSKKLTRAQKRRIKKSQKQKEREKAIADQDAMNLLGCRETETAAISKKLAERKLSLFEIPSDGNCLYRAVEHQLGILNIQNVTAKELRQLTATYLLSHRQDFTPFLVDPDTGNYMTYERYVKYCNDIVDANTWGGHIEVCALSKIFGKPIEIIQADRDITIGDESASPKLKISYHRNLYRLGAHYNSVIPADVSM